jgi:hypothetical protein
MADYCTLADLKENPDLGLSGTTSYDDALPDYITRASRMIDRALGKWDNYFYPITVDETRYYTSGDDCLDIDEAVSITSIAVSEGGEVTSSGYTSLAATDWYAWPYNYAAKAEPIRRIELDTVNGNYYSFYGYPKGVKIVGVFGYSATPPEDIKQACIIQATSLFMQEKQGWRDASASAELGQMVYTAGIHPVANEILQKYIYKSVIP